MPVGASRTGTGVTVTVARDPALVRTVRLVVAAVARRAERDEEFVEEVRLAAGEACALLLGDLPEDPTSADPVSVTLSLDDRLEVRVESSAPVATEDPPHSDIDGMEPWALLRGLVRDFRVVRRDGTTTVTMAWPLS